MWNSNSLVAWLLADQRPRRHVAGATGRWPGTGLDSGPGTGPAHGSGRVQHRGELLDAVDQPRAGPGPHRRRRRRRAPDAGRQQRRATSRRPEPARRRGRSRTAPRPPRPGGRLHVVPGDPHRLLARGAEHAGSPPASSTISGIQWPGAYGGSVHSSTATRGRGRPMVLRQTAAIRSRSDCTSSAAASSWPVALPSSSTESSTSSRVCGSTVSTSAVQPRWASAASTVGDVDRADRAQVLGDHERRVEGAQRVGGEVVEVLAPRDRVDDVGVDLGRRQPRGHRGGRHDRAAARLGRGVALEGHADHVVARAEGEQDLGGRGEQGHDPHERQPRVARWTTRR